jgi:predicted nucleotidyltransferase
MSPELIQNGLVTLDELRRAQRDEILRIATKHGARNVRVFGSLARGENSPSSDIDLLVDMDPNRSLMDLGGLLMDLQATLDTRVDVATVDMLRPKVRQRALLDAVPL